MRFDTALRILDDLPIGVLVSDHDGFLTYANAAARRMLGGDPSKLNMDRPYQLFVSGTDDPYPTLDRPIQRALAGHITHTDDMELRTAAGSIEVEGWGIPLLDHEGRAVGGVSAFVDVTGRKLLEAVLAARGDAEGRESTEALRVSEARKTAILSSAPIAIVTMDDEDRVDEFNPAAERMFGYPAAEMMGRTLDDLFVTPLPGLGGRAQLMARRADGSGFRAEVEITVVAGVESFVTAFIRDLTEQDAAEAERLTVEGTLHQSQRLESLGELAGGVAHDFNNLLAVILNYARFVADAVPDSPEVQADVATILTATDQAVRLTRQLLMFARREPIIHETLDLNEIVADIHALLTSSLGAHVELVLRPGAGVPAISADRGQIEQVMVNLAVNARDAMADGGRLTIETARGERGEAKLCVSDTGSGMSPEVVARAFDPFFTTKAATENSGLGLASVHGIVTQLGGTVTLESKEGRGTTVVLHLPATEAPPEPARAASTVRRQARGETILVIDDQPRLLSLTVRILRNAGYQVFAAATGAEAMAIAGQQRLDLVLSDVVMPKLAGPEIVQRLKHAQPDLRVLYMSGYPRGAAGQGTPLPDGAALIQKPFDDRALLERVGETLAAGPA